MSSTSQGYVSMPHYTTQHSPNLQRIRLGLYEKYLKWSDARSSQKISVQCVYIYTLKLKTHQLACLKLLSRKNSKSLITLSTASTACWSLNGGWMRSSISSYSGHGCAYSAKAYDQPRAKKWLQEKIQAAHHCNHCRKKSQVLGRSSLQNS